MPHYYIDVRSSFGLNEDMNSIEVLDLTKARADRLNTKPPQVVERVFASVVNVIYVTKLRTSKLPLLKQRGFLPEGPTMQW